MHLPPRSTSATRWAGSQPDTYIVLQLLDMNITSYVSSNVHRMWSVTTRNSNKILSILNRPSILTCREIRSKKGINQTTSQNTLNNHILQARQIKQNKLIGSLKQIPLPLMPQCIPTTRSRKLQQPQNKQITTPLKKHANSSTLGTNPCLRPPLVNKTHKPQPPSKQNKRRNLLPKQTLIKRPLKPPHPSAILVKAIGAPLKPQNPHQHPQRPQIRRIINSRVLSDTTQIGQIGIKIDPSSALFLEIGDCISRLHKCLPPHTLR